MISSNSIYSALILGTKTADALLATRKAEELTAVGAGLGGITSGAAWV